MLANVVVAAAFAVAAFVVAAVVVAAVVAAAYAGRYEERRRVITSRSLHTCLFVFCRSCHTGWCVFIPAFDAHGDMTSQ